MWFHFRDLKMKLILINLCIGLISGNVIDKDLNEESNLNSLDYDDHNIPKVRHRDFRKYKDPFMDGRSYDLQYCRRPAKCEALKYSVCFGAKLPYHSTTLELTDLKSQDIVQEKLHLFQYLRFIPKCWAVIQPFLCALYMPKCVNGTVDLPSREMCKITLEPCKIFYNNPMFSFSEFLNCEDERLFPSKCKNDVLELKYNTTAYCMEPLVKTEEQSSFYPDVEGCGLQCKDSLYNEKEHYQIQKLIAYCFVSCLLLNSFTIATFIIDWKTLNKYPALAIFYVNICFLISYSGWLIQFLGNETREDIVCKKDGTLRKSEPSANENLSCVVVFVMVYYFLIAGMVWFVIFVYAWNMSSLQALGRSQEDVNKKRAYFHLVAWSLPLVFTITTMALGEIDGDYVTGICIVGIVNMGVKVGLLLAPLLASLIVSLYITTRGLRLLIEVRQASKEISEHYSRKIRSNIVRMSVNALFIVVFSVITFVYHTYVHLNAETWAQGLRNYILCKLTSFSNDFSHCKHESRPSVAMLQLQILAIFGAGVSMASWVWYSTTIDAWKRYIKRKFHCGQEKPVKLQKHRIIAQAFSKRKKFNQGGRISIDCQMHPDPLGLNFDSNSADTNGISSTWVANLPRLLCRRGAVPNEVTYSFSSNNQSIDSEVSLNVRHVSIESRRNSGDSQLSVQIAELKATRKVNTRRHRNRMRQKDFRRNSRDIVSSNRRLSKTESKRASRTSLDSHLQIINDLTNNCNSKKPNLNRRTANAGLDGLDIQAINNILVTGKLIVPYCSDDENENASLTISESK